MKIYGISGLGADERVFQFLNLNHELIPLLWIQPRKNESIEAYSKRFSEKIEANEPFGIIGVSFGGLIAVEISKILKPEITVLISSAETKFELRRLYRLVGKSRLIKLIPYRLFNPPRRIAIWLFGAKRKSLLRTILDDTDLRFAKWAVQELANWKNTDKLTNPTLKIGGSKDKLIPTKENAILVKEGQHFMIVDKAKEISEIINEKIKSSRAGTTK